MGTQDDAVLGYLDVSTDSTSVSSEVDYDVPPSSARGRKTDRRSPVAPAVVLVATATTKRSVAMVVEQHDVCRCPKGDTNDVLRSSVDLPM